MTALALTLVLALVAFWFVWRLVRGHSTTVHDLRDLEGCMRAVDLEAFKNLVDRSQDAYLRVHLSRRQFRRIERQRKRAAIEYLTWTASNAAVLLRVGEAARNSSDPSVASAGNRLVEAALAVRVRSMLAIVSLYVAMVFPGTSLSVSAAVVRYEQLRDALYRFGQLREPVLASRISSAL